MKVRLDRSQEVKAFRLIDAFLLRTVRRIGRHPRFRALEVSVCKWFLALFAAFLVIHIILAAIRYSTRG